MSQGKRGKVLERMIEQSNKVYRQRGLGLIHKNPTPWTIHYNKRNGRVSKAFPKEKGTVDFEGVSHGKSIAFDAKSTNDRNKFPLANIKQHQIDYLVDHQRQGGRSFFIIDFAKYGEIYFLPINKAVEWWEDQFNGGRKSIPYDWFVMNCSKIISTEGVMVNYLKYC